jgi:hypothetical protein
VIGDLFEEPGSAPASVDPDCLIADVGKLAPDAVLIWDTATHAKYPGVVIKLQQAYPDATTSSISDPVKGNVGTLIVLKKRT